MKKELKIYGCIIPLSIYILMCVFGIIYEIPKMIIDYYTAIIFINGFLGVLWLGKSMMDTKFAEKDCNQVILKWVRKNLEDVNCVE